MHYSSKVWGQNDFILNKWILVYIKLIKSDIKDFKKKNILFQINA